MEATDKQDAGAPEPADHTTLGPLGRSAGIPSASALSWFESNYLLKPPECF